MIFLFATIFSSPATNSPLKTVFIFIESYRYITLVTLCSSIISLASSRNRRGSICLSPRLSERLLNAILMTRQRNPYPASTCTNLPRTDSFRLSSRAIHAISDAIYYRLIIAFDTALLLNDSINSSLFPCAVLLSCIKQLAESNPCYQLRCWID